MTKYHATPTERDNIRFASKAEAARYDQLKAMLRAGEIRDLRWQVSYPLVVNGVKVARYVADYVYWQDGRTVVEDVKGYKTPVYRLKRKLMLALYGIEIAEVSA